MAINSAFSTLCQLGVGPRQQFRIQDANAQWSEFFGTETNIDSVKDYINLRVALIFDLNAATSYVIQARERQVKELEWRLSVEADRLYFAPDIIDGAEDMG